MAEEEKVTIVLRKIPKDTEKSVIEEHLKQFEGEIDVYIAKATSPYCFAKVPKDKHDEALSTEFKVGDEVVEVQDKIETKKFLVENANDGDLGGVNEEDLKKYFESKGNVLELKLRKDKKTWFLKMEDAGEAQDLGWALHKITAGVKQEGEDAEEESKEITVNVKELQNRKRKGGRGWGRRGKRRKGRGRGRR